LNLSGYLDRPTRRLRQLIAPGLAHTVRYFVGSAATATGSALGVASAAGASAS
jgi:hypothetical protein